MAQRAWREKRKRNSEKKYQHIDNRVAYGWRKCSGGGNIGGGNKRRCTEARGENNGEENVSYVGNGISKRNGAAEKKSGINGGVYLWAAAASRNQKHNG